VRFERGGSRRGCRFQHLVKGDGAYNPGCLLSARTLRRIRWPLQPRSRDRIPASATIRTLDDALTPPWAFAGSAPFLYGAARLATWFHATWSPAFHRRRPRRTRPPFTPAGPLFGGRIASLFGTQRRLPTSATALRRAGTSPSSRSPRRDGGRNLLPFLTCHAAFLAESGEHAASRAPSAKRDPGAGSSCFRRFARPRYPVERATGGGLRRLRVMAIDVHGSLDRAKDASPNREVQIALSMGACASYAHADGVPLLSDQRTPRCRRRARRKRRRPLSTEWTGLGPRSNATPRRVAPSRRPRCLRPSRRKDAEGLLLRTLLRPPAHAAHTLPTAVGSCFRGALQAPDAEGTPPEHSRVRAPFEPAGKPVPGTDDPSTPAWLGRRGR
jgi:hypothetical protein